MLGVGLFRQTMCQWEENGIGRCFILGKYKEQRGGSVAIPPLNQPQWNSDRYRRGSKTIAKLASSENKIFSSIITEIEDICVKTPNTPPLGGVLWWRDGWGEILHFELECTAAHLSRTTIQNCFEHHQLQIAFLLTHISTSVSGNLCSVFVVCCIRYTLHVQ